MLGGTFSRIQFTPDLVPSDLVGTRIYKPRSSTFDVELGPVFCNFLLADEINRAPAKVQSALLEVMQERQVTIGGGTNTVPDPFLVMATQNPIESEGTYPLPEAQVDRFMLKVVVDYPATPDELIVVERSLVPEPDARARALTLEELLGLQETTRDVYVDPAVMRYAVALAVATRDPAAHGLPELAPYVAFGASPRGPINLVHAGARAGPDPRPPLRAPAGRARAREGRAPPPARAHLPGAGRGASRPTRSSTPSSAPCRCRRSSSPRAEASA